MRPPPNQIAVQDDSGTVLPQWKQYFSEVYNAITAQQASGTTAQRPTKGLFIGRSYFDVTLGYRIEYNGTNWVKWDGVTV